MLSFPEDYRPPNLSWVPRKPRQFTGEVEHCPRRAADLMPEATWRRVERWLQRSLDDLICIRDFGEACERQRPSVLVIGQSELHPWARGIIWDFRSAHSGCAKALDFHAPLQHTLNVEYLTRRLAEYPNQQLVSFLVHGAQPLADVELQTVMVPHLLSLAKGFPSVVKEIKRMASPELGWYSMHADFPFWPIYSLGEGSVPRKLENRWRRCEEGGGPRKEVFDQANVRAWSINDASRLPHFPQHFAQDRRPEWLEYLKARGLPADAETLKRIEANRGTKWHRQYLPRLAQAMRSLLVLKRAAYLMQEPVYLFGDDIKDYFVNAAEVLNLMNTVFLAGRR